MIKFSQQPVTKQQKIVFSTTIWIWRDNKIKSTLACKIVSTLNLDFNVLKKTQNDKCGRVALNVRGYGSQKSNDRLEFLGY